MPVGRLAPSPTGAQHLGNARTYLLAYWSARHDGAKLILRIEDINSPRVKDWATQQVIDDLHWLGIDWDAGPDVGGEEGPYLQTERSDRYHAALGQLIDSGRVYPCVCTRKDIAAAADAPHAGAYGTVYPGTCAVWKPGDPIPETGTFSWRFRCADQPIRFHDRVAGEQQCVPAVDLGDFPVTRKTGEPAYQLAVVVDDAAMGISEVVRGDDLLPSTFWQLELYAALGKTPPQFAHVPLVLGPDGRRLAKRHGDTRLSHYREQGVAPQQIVRWAAETAGLLPQETPVADGELPAMHRELPEMHRELIERFDWRRVSRDEVTVDRFP